MNNVNNGYLIQVSIHSKIQCLEQKNIIIVYLPTNFIHYYLGSGFGTLGLVCIIKQGNNWTLFFENRQGQAISVNGVAYRRMLNDFQ